jgi:hypothetical protein
MTRNAVICVCTYPALPLRLPCIYVCARANPRLP